jgi:1-acyl-sn-glycerol-3-phosphate acyltransferase
VSGVAPERIEALPVQLPGSRIARALLRLAGWKFLFDGLPSRQGIIVVYPHTSNWDFVFGMLAKWGMGIPANFWAKDSLFRVPVFGAWLRSLGGLPVARGARSGIVASTAAALSQARDEDRFMWLALAPEGTRGHGAGWKSGFYRVALQARVPVAVAVIDYAHRRVGIDSFWSLSGDPDADFAAFAARLEGCRGYRPHLAAPVRLLER